MQIEALMAAGLCKTDALVYLALLKIGSSFAGEITKAASINRTNVYDSLERLAVKGLVSSVISDGKKLFSPANPHIFKKMLEEKEQKLNSVLPLLENQFHALREVEEAFVFRGRKGVKAIFEDVLQEGKTMYAYGAEGKFSELFPIYQKQWNAKRNVLKVQMKMLFNEKVKEKHKETMGLIEIKYLPKNYQFPSITIVYGDKTLIISWEEPIFCFLIKSKAVTKSNMNFFNILWKTAKK